MRLNSLYSDQVFHTFCLVRSSSVLKLRSDQSKFINLVHAYHYFFMYGLINILRGLSALFLVLQFDGSLRAPTDPNQDIIPTFLSSTLAPFATCSFALLDDSKIRVLGGKEILCSQITSADVEYEGLILGLQGLKLFFEQRDGDSSYRDHVVVQGDCKTVIDQMNGISIPRKQRNYYDEAKSIVLKLREDHEVLLNFEHVNRCHNELCDGMCKIIMHHLQRSVVTLFLDTVKKAEETFVSGPLPINKKKRIKFDRTTFSAPLNLISNWDGRVPLSMRPFLLCELYHACNRVSDYVGTRLIGETMRMEANRWANLNITYMQDLDLMGLKIISASLHSLDLRREAAKIEETIVQMYDQTTYMDRQAVLKLQERMPGLEKFGKYPIRSSKAFATYSRQGEKIEEWQNEIISNVHALTPIISIYYD